jgi:RNA polymerase sigma factor (sigma-70 family)
VALDDEMNALARFDPRKVQVVEMRFFGGLSLEETAEVLKISSGTVRRDLRTAKAWLSREITGDRESTGGSTDGLGTPETNR